MIDPRTEAKLKKLLALAERGEGGEKETASRMLEKMLAKHGMTLDDLTGSETEQLYWFSVKGDHERKLFCQILAMVLNERAPSTYSSNKRRGKMGIKVLPSQMIEFDLHFSALRKALADHLDVSWCAFVQSNKIFPECGGGKDSDLTERDIKIVMMAGMIDKTQVHKQIGSVGVVADE